MKHTILDQTKIAHIVKRIAYQIYEGNLLEERIAIVGIGKTGLALGELLKEELIAINRKLSLNLMKIELDKSNPDETIKLIDQAEMTGIPVIIVDDVMNTGKTITYCIKKLLESSPSKVEIATLVDRGHRKFPIMSTYCGYELSTTLEEHVEVQLGEKQVVYLH